MKRTLNIIIGSLLLLTGCATRLATTSGKPEVTIHNKTSDQVKDVCVEHFVKIGWLVRNSDKYLLTFEKEAGTAASLLMGSTLNPTVNQRIMLNVVTVGNDSVKVIATPFMVSNPGSGFERPVQMTGKACSQVQQHLEMIAHDLGETDLPNVMPPKPVASQSTTPAAPAAKKF